MFERLLVPLDGSDLAEEALPIASELAQAFNGLIILYSVTRSYYVAVDTSGTTYTEMLLDLEDQMLEESENYLKGHCEVLQKSGIRAEVLVEEGENIAGLILAAAERLAVDIIVMSTHGRGGMRRLVFGSVADKVLQRATIPVLLVRKGES